MFLIFWGGIPGKPRTAVSATHQTDILFKNNRVVHITLCHIQFFPVTPSILHGTLLEQRCPNSVLQGWRTLRVCVCACMSVHTVVGNKPPLYCNPGGLDLGTPGLGFTSQMIFKGTRVAFLARLLDILDCVQRDSIVPLS